jgi:hypothetical protein
LTTETLTTEGSGLRRVTGALFLIGALAFAFSATILSATFDWPDILRQPADVVLPELAAGGPSLVWTWFATAWTYAILAVPILLLPAALGRRDDAALRVGDLCRCDLSSPRSYWLFAMGFRRAAAGASLSRG